MDSIHVDTAIVGGGLGGIAAALSLLEHGYRVLLTEEYRWIGGQATSQAVPPDENHHIETFGSTKSYQLWRSKVRDYYRNHYPLTQEAKEDPYLNIGKGIVSNMCQEPWVVAKIFDELLDSYVESKQLILLKETTVVDATTDEGMVSSITISQKTKRYRVTADYFIDATELGDLLPLTDTEYTLGSEAQTETQEFHASQTENPLNQQALTWCFAISRDVEGSNHTIPKPENYTFYKEHVSSFWPGSQLSWTYSHPITLEPTLSGLEPNKDVRNLWPFRRIVCRDNFQVDSGIQDITLVNWPQNDYWHGPLLGVSIEEQAHHYKEAKELSKAWLYWMQTEAPRPNGKIGYPELKCVPEILGTSDGFAMAPYIRESRRIKALTQVTEADIGYEMRLAQRNNDQEASVTAKQFPDSVGIGYYRIDLHPSTSGENYIDIESLPFQIPLGSLIPKETYNLLAGGKNIGTTHITNGCYRLHPVEWNVGESAGQLVAYCLKHEMTPHFVHSNRQALSDFQRQLQKAGIPISWPEDQLAGLH